MLEYENITDNIMIIKINKNYRPDMTPDELYEVTRGFWKRTISSASEADYALAVVNNEVKEVFKITNGIKQAHWITKQEIFPMAIFTEESNLMGTLLNRE